MGRAYTELLQSDRDSLMLQLQTYAACDDEVVRVHVRRRFAELVAFAGQLSGTGPERLDEFIPRRDGAERGGRARRRGPVGRKRVGARGAELR